MFTQIDNFKTLISGHISINTPSDYKIYNKNIGADRYSEENYESLEQQNTHILKDEELYTWWGKTMAKYGNEAELKTEQDELDCLQLDRIYDARYHIGLDAYCLVRNYFSIYEKLTIDDVLPADWSEEKKEDFNKKYPEFMSARLLQRNSPEIYKLGYIDKIKIGDTLITEVKFKLLDNSFTLKEDEGFTLNDIAYLAGNLFKVNFWFTDYYRKNACIFMYLTLDSSSSLICKVGCDT